jgi:hypothetical protein
MVVSAVRELSWVVVGVLFRLVHRNASSLVVVWGSVVVWSRVDCQERCGQSSASVEGGCGSRAVGCEVGFFSYHFMFNNCHSRCASLRLRLQPGKKKEAKVEEEVKLGPTVREGEDVFGVAHIYASFNDTFVVRVDCPVWR